MNLILWRHAEAEDGCDDLARELTGNGRRQAELSARWLKRHAPANLRVIVSPAKRTRQTADALKLDYQVLPELAPGADPEELLAAAGWPEADDTVLLVGHQPTLGATIRMLLADTVGPWSVRKSGIWWLSRRERDEMAQVVVRAVVNPEFL